MALISLWHSVWARTPEGAKCFAVCWSRYLLPLGTMIKFLCHANLPVKKRQIEYPICQLTCHWISLRPKPLNSGFGTIGKSREVSQFCTLQPDIWVNNRIGSIFAASFNQQSKGDSAWSHKLNFNFAIVETSIANAAKWDCHSVGLPVIADRSY